MCFSKIYLDEVTQDTLVMEEASSLKVEPTSVSVGTMFGESKTFDNYGIQEIDLVENFVILKKKGATDDA